MSPRKWYFRLHDISAAALKIESYTSGMTYEDFVADDKTVDAVIRIPSHRFPIPMGVDC